MSKKAKISQKQVFEFDDSEVAVFRRRFQEGYDLKTDARYNAWLAMQCTSKSLFSIQTIKIKIMILKL